MAETRYWLVKSEPSAYAWAQLVKDGRTEWTGVRNFEARNNLRAMKKGDAVLYYHSNEGKAVVGIARVTREAQPDATAKKDVKGDWVSVELAPLKPLANEVTLAQIKTTPALGKMQILTRPRISVIAVTAAEWKRISKMGGL